MSVNVQKNGELLQIAGNFDNSEDIEELRAQIVQIKTKIAALESSAAKLDVSNAFTKNQIVKSDTNALPLELQGSVPGLQFSKIGGKNGLNLYSIDDDRLHVNGGDLKNSNYLLYNNDFPIFNNSSINSNLIVNAYDNFNLTKIADYSIAPNIYGYYAILTTLNAIDSTRNINVASFSRNNRIMPISLTISNCYTAIAQYGHDTNGSRGIFVILPVTVINANTTMPLFFIYSI